MTPFFPFQIVTLLIFLTFLSKILLFPIHTMKFSYNSSTYSTNYEDIVFQSKPVTAGCIHRILRRFFCFNTSLLTHPSDHSNAEAAIACRPQENTQSDIGETSATAPGLVARLMGLDSMPMIIHKNLNSVRRTKSMDSFRDVELVRRKHRHVKSTLSFRDAPTNFIELEDEQFFILSFESGGESKELGSKSRKSDLGFLDIRTKRSEIKTRDNNKSRQNIQQSVKENQETDQVSNNNSTYPSTVLCPIKSCDVHSDSPEIVKKKIKKPINNVKTEGGRLRKNKKDQNLKKVETECDSENTSPVSVLEYSELPIEFEVPSAVHKARLITSNSRRILFEELNNYSTTPSIGNTIVDNDQKVERNGDKCAEFWKRSDKHSQNFSKMWEEECRFAEIYMKQTKWMYRGVLDIAEFDEITATFEFKILDQLLQELVDQVFSL